MFVWQKISQRKLTSTLFRHNNTFDEKIQNSIPTNKNHNNNTFQNCTLRHCTRLPFSRTQTPPNLGLAQKYSWNAWNCNVAAELDSKQLYKTKKSKSIKTVSIIEPRWTGLDVQPATGRPLCSFLRNRQNLPTPANREKNIYLICLK